MNQSKGWRCDNPLCHALNKPEWDKRINCGKPRITVVIIDGKRVGSLGEFIGDKGPERGTP